MKPTGLRSRSRSQTVSLKEDRIGNTALFKILMNFFVFNSKLVSGKIYNREKEEYFVR